MEVWDIRSLSPELALFTALVEVAEDLALPGVMAAEVQKTRAPEMVQTIWLALTHQSIAVAVEVAAEHIVLTEGRVPLVLWFFAK